MAHLVPKTLIELPFVDRIPNPEERPDQRRIDWIRNGDCLGAAAHAADNSGELNRGPVQVQNNAVTLLENEKIITSSLNEIIIRVNSLDDTLGEIGDDNLATEVAELKATVEPLNDKITLNEQDIFVLKEQSTNLYKKLGNRDQLDLTVRDVYEDLFWTKKEIGNWIGRDVNDNVDVEIAESTGLKGRITTQGLGIASNERRIIRLEEDWKLSDVGALTTEVRDLRSELGDTADAPDGVPNVYSWIKHSEEKHNELDADVARIDAAIGSATGETINERIDQNITEINKNKQNILTNTNAISDIRTVIGNDTTENSIEFKLKDTIDKTTELVRVVGKNEQFGLQKTVLAIQTDIGTDDLQDSIKFRINTAEDNVAEAQRNVASLTTQVGISTSGSETGLYKRVVANEKTLYTPTTGLAALTTKLGTDILTKIDDAPSDGKLYGRQNETWTEVTTTSKEKPQLTDDLQIPATKRITTTTSTDLSVSLMGMSTHDVIEIGDKDSEIQIVSKIRGYDVVPDFKIMSSINQPALTASFNGVYVGSESYTAVLCGSGIHAPVVELSSGNRQEIAHEGNVKRMAFPILGGFEFENVIVTNGLLSFDGTNMEFNRGIDVSRGTITTMQNSTVMIVAELNIKSSDDQQISIELIKNGSMIGVPKNLTLNGEESVVIQRPCNMTEGGTINIRITNATETATVTLTHGSVYLYSI